MSFGYYMTAWIEEPPAQKRSNQCRQEILRSYTPSRETSAAYPELTTMNTQANLFADLPEYAGDELFTTLLENPRCRIERIVSYGQASPEGFWYDQDWDEWVLLISGSAELDLSGELHALRPGDHLLIKAGVRHRVKSTSNTEKTVWLAVHLTPNERSL